MRLTITTWNINSVRLRIEQVRRFVDETRPDILCLQETKCPEPCFPMKHVQSFGYRHVVHAEQKGYNGVAILSRLPLADVAGMDFCDRRDARHITARLGPGAGPAAGIVIHNFYVPAGGDLPDPARNWKFAHKLSFLSEMRQWGASARPAADPAVLVGDLNVAPLEHDVWSHRQMLGVVSHTPVETEALETLRRDAGWIDAARHLQPEPEKIYTWWSYRSPDWQKADKGRRLDHIWLSSHLGGALRTVEVARDARAWMRPSDHVPVTATLDI